ncbi:hypothetical protein Hanom_Chr15g01340521 [Helianthus anomalus]
MFTTFIIIIHSRHSSPISLWYVPNYSLQRRLYKDLNQDIKISHCGCFLYLSSNVCSFHINLGSCNWVFIPPPSPLIIEDEEGF